MNPNEYILDKDAAWVQRWEEREVEFRGKLDTLREELEKRYSRELDQKYRDRLNMFDRTIHEQQAIILKIREIPLIGSKLVRWAETHSDYEPTRKRTIGIRG